LSEKKTEPSAVRKRPRAGLVARLKVFLAASSLVWRGVSVADVFDRVVQ